MSLRFTVSSLRPSLYFCSLRLFTFVFVSDIKGDRKKRNKGKKRKLTFYFYVFWSPRSIERLKINFYLDDGTDSDEDTYITFELRVTGYKYMLFHLRDFSFLFSPI